MSERKAIKNKDEKSKDYKAKFVIDSREFETPVNKGAAPFTITVTDKDGNVLLAYDEVTAVIMAVATLGDAVEGDEDAREVRENIGSVAIEAEELSALASTFTSMWPVWLDEHPSIREAVAETIRGALKKPFVG